MKILPLLLRGTNPGTDGPPTLPMQAYPTDTRVCHMVDRGRTTTAIARTWADGDERRCRLCPNCQDRPVCLLMISGYVSEEDAPLFSVVGLVERVVDGRNAKVVTRG